jgi:SsrA-binding protein
MKQGLGQKIIVSNRKAFYDYFLSDFVEAGMVLTGTEIKSIRQGGSSLMDCYVIIRNGEVFLLNMHIAPYDKGSVFNHDPRRSRKLLLHKHEIIKLESKVHEKGLTLIPTKVYFHKGRVKIEIALAKAKQKYDKRETIKKRDDQRMMDKAKKGQRDE